MAETKFKMADLLRFFEFYVNNIWPCGRDKINSFSFILLKCVMYVTKKWFDNGRNKFIKFNNGGGLLSSVLLL